MAYKFQLGAARLSGSLIQEGDITAASSDVTAVSASVAQLSASATIASPDFVASAGEVVLQSAASAESGMDIKNGLQLDSVAVTATAAELNIMDGVTASTAEINHLGGVTSGVQTQLNAKLAKASNLSDLTDAATARRNLGVEIGVDVQAYDAELATLSGMSSAAATAAAALTDAEYGFLDGAQAGSAQASKALVVNASRDVSGIGNLGAAQLSASADVYAGGGLYGQSIGLADASGIIAVSGGLAQTAGEMHLDPNVAGSGLTLTNGVLDLDLGEASAGSVAVADDSFLFVDATDGSTKKDSFSNFAGRIAGDGLGDASGVLSVNVAAGLEISGDNIQVSASGITNAMLAGSITAEKLALGDALDSDAGALAVQVDGSSIEVDTVDNHIQVKAGGITNAMLAGSIASSKIAELNAFSTSDLSEGTNLYYTDARVHAALDVSDTNSIDMSYDSGLGRFSAALILASAGALQVDGNGLDLKSTISGNRSFTGDITINNLNVTGTLTTVNTTELEVADKNILIASGSASAAIAAGAGLTVDGADVQWKFEENGIGSALASGHIWMASGSAGLIDIQAENFYGNFVGSFSQAVYSDSDGGTLQKGITISSHNSSVTFTLPALSASSVGDTFKIKGNSTTSNTNSITIEAAGSDLIDGGSSIVLESPHAAVEIVYTAGTWSIF